jgi:tetratricopeptide (TPR) repeat protein
MVDYKVVLDDSFYGFALKQGRTYIALVIILAIIGPSACASIYSEERVEWCLTLAKERRAASNAQDWPQLERLANQFLGDCKHFLDSKLLSKVYEDLASAHHNRGNLLAALEASEKCIDIFYTNHGCHQTKVMVLINLGRKSEALAACEIAERLIAHLIKVNQSNLRQASRPIDKERYSAEQELLEFRKKLLEGMRLLYLIS